GMVYAIFKECLTLLAESVVDRLAGTGFPLRAKPFGDDRDVAVSRSQAGDGNRSSGIPPGRLLGGPWPGSTGIADGPIAGRGDGSSAKGAGEIDDPGLPDRRVEPYRLVRHEARCPRRHPGRIPADRHLGCGPASLRAPARAGATGRALGRGPFPVSSP